MASESSSSTSDKALTAAAPAPASAPANAREECGVCCGKMTEPVAGASTYTSRSPRVRVTCASCQHSACRLCVQKFLLSIAEDPYCMNCRAQWSLSFVSRTCSVSFVKGALRAHRSVMLRDRERAWMPFTMEQLELRRQFEERTLLDAEVNHSYTLLGQQDLMARNEELMRSTAEDYARALQRRLSTPMVTRFAEPRNGKMYTVYRLLTPAAGAGGNATGAGAGAGAGGVSERRQFTRPCPAPDCRGMLTSAWRCAVCSTRVCRDCFEVKCAGTVPEDEAGSVCAQHTCQPDALATADMLRKSCKPCPKCATPIFKISGCDQMFCTSCNTPFLWSTLQILRTGFIHNPHYFEYLDHLRNTGVANPGAHVMAQNAAGAAAGGGNPCDQHARRDIVQTLTVQNYVMVGDPTLQRNLRLMSSVRTILLEMIETMTEVARGAIPFGVSRSLTAFARDCANSDVNLEPQRRNDDLRASFARGQITEHDFGRALTRRENDRERVSEIQNVYAFTTDALVDCIGRHAVAQTGDVGGIPYVQRSFRTSTVEGRAALATALAEVRAVLAYANEQVRDIVNRYRRPVYFPNINRDNETARTTSTLLWESMTLLRIEPLVVKRPAAKKGGRGGGGGGGGGEGGGADDSEENSDDDDADNAASKSKHRRKRPAVDDDDDKSSSSEGDVRENVPVVVLSDDEEERGEVLWGDELTQFGADEEVGVAEHAFAARYNRRMRALTRAAERRRRRRLQQEGIE